MQAEEHTEVPRFKNSWNKDIISGFLVFLIALPLCLGISLACGYPAISGIFTAIIGGITATFLSNSELTIKGPAAGLIVIAIGCVTDFGFTSGQNPTADFEAYRMALAVGVASGLLQVLLGLFKTGKLSEFFPTSVVHGMLAAIGVIIIVKQLPIVFGTSAKGGPLELLINMPKYLSNLNPEIAAIGLMSLLILFVIPLFKNKYLSKVPGPMLVVLAAIPLGMYFDLSHNHTYSFAGKAFNVGEIYLVDVPSNLFSVMTFPNFSALRNPIAWKWVVMFLMIGSLESLLSAKAIDLSDPWKRKTDMNKDLVAIGVGNTIAALIGGLPMISEIVRSKANIDNGAQTRMANLFHGMFLLLFVALVPSLLHQIPLSALAAMLVYTGCRLASPKEFKHIYHVGSEQLIIFTSTLIGVLATDLLIGVGIGIAVKFGIHLKNGASFRSFLKPEYDFEKNENSVKITPRQDTLFCNWLSLKSQINKHGITVNQSVEIDFSNTKLIDHTVMSKLNEMKGEFGRKNLTLSSCGLDQHVPLSSHKLAARKLVKKIDKTLSSSL